jgi:hypothetical protein
MFKITLNITCVKENLNTFIYKEISKLQGENLRGKLEARGCDCREALRAEIFAQHGCNHAERNDGDRAVVLLQSGGDISR